jgi:hypothetical protein
MHLNVHLDMHLNMHLNMHMHLTRTAPAQVQACKRMSLETVGEHIRHLCSGRERWMGRSYSQEDLWGRVSEATGHLMDGPLLQRLHEAMEQKAASKREADMAEGLKQLRASEAARAEVREQLAALRSGDGWVGDMHRDMRGLVGQVYDALSQPHAQLELGMLEAFMQGLVMGKWTVTTGGPCAVPEQAAAVFQKLVAAVRECLTCGAADLQRLERRQQEREASRQRGKDFRSLEQSLPPLPLPGRGGGRAAWGAEGGEAGRPQAGVKGDDLHGGFLRKGGPRVASCAFCLQLQATTSHVLRACIRSAALCSV